MAAEGWGEKEICREVEVGKQRLPLPEVIVILQNSVRPRTEFLIGAASAVIWESFWYFALAGEKERRQTPIVKLLVSIPLSRKYRIQYVSCIRIGTNQVLVLMKEIMTGKRQA